MAWETVRARLVALSSQSCSLCLAERMEKKTIATSAIRKPKTRIITVVLARIGKRNFFFSFAILMKKAV